MQGALGGLRGTALALLAWLVLGLALAGLLAAAGGRWAASLLFAVPLTLLYGWATGFSAYYLCRARPLGRHRSLPAAAAVMSAAALAALLWTGAGAAWSALWRTLAPDWGGIAFAPSLAATMFGLGVVLYVLSVLANYLAIEVERARELQVSELRTRLAAQEAELRMLRTQVDPHFLFNSLNSISALTSIDPKLARDMTLRLAEFFRHTLALESHSHVTLETELQLVRHFVAIEQVRFGVRLAFEEHTTEDAQACLLPPMLLQPLVENAVKHGIGRMLGAGAVRVKAVRAGSILRISVENDVDPDAGPAPAHASSGLGLANVRQRLAAAYAHEASTNWALDGATFRVDIALPAQTGED